MISNETALLDCPFCGGDAERLELTDEANFGGSVICCKKCGASSPVHFDRKENLDSSWNDRIARTPADGPEPVAVIDDLTRDELRGRAVRALREAGWRASDKLSLHSVIETLIAFGINIMRDKPASCGWPDCGCDADAVCNAAITHPAPADGPAGEAGDLIVEWQARYRPPVAEIDRDWFCIDRDRYEQDPARFEYRALVDAARLAAYQAQLAERPDWPTVNATYEKWKGRAEALAAYQADGSPEYANLTTWKNRAEAAERELAELKRSIGQ